ncbi:hypothetical protein [Ammoniphilus sp. 3BR4]|uniref:hypothetical protein n=1 Tax=Ammoniphilus sp. 3BR4 TaxID=3158265 RepID=UPI0034675184
MKKNIILLLAGLLSLIVLSGCSNPSHAESQVVLRFAYASNSQPVKDAMSKFGELLSEKTNGEVVVEYRVNADRGS